VLGEDRLHGIDDRPLQADGGVAPMVPVLAVPHPLPGDAMAKNVTRAAVEDRQLAVGPLVELAEVEDPQRVVHRDAHAGLPHEPELPAVAADGAHGVDHEPDLDPFAGTGGKGPRQLGTDLAPPPDVALEVNGLARRRDVL
jgi:hypothetical protein